MIAQIIVNNNSKQVDKFYDYVVPEGLSEDFQVGLRVIVPFGKGDKHIEGYVMKISGNSERKGLKEIVRIIDKVFDEKMLELIEWMKNRYMCSYIDLIRTAVPAGISVKPEQWLVLTKKSTDAVGVKKRVLDLLADNGGAMEINRLMQFFKTNVRTQVNQLCKEGFIRLEYRNAREVNDKIIRMARLCVSSEEAVSAAERLEKRAPLQARALDILASNEYISLTDLVQFSGGSYNVVQSLEKKGFLSFENKVVERNPLSDKNIPKTVPPKLTSEQERTVQKIREQAQGAFLLHGVTGSGKTEVYMQIIGDVLSAGKTAIMLVPEIALTPQTVARVVGRFGKRVAVFHSGLSMGERYDEWKRIRDKKADIVIGARSAVFAPLDNIGVIIMDEEHEQSYKSEMVPRYSTREVAEYRAKQNKAMLILSSATPSVESYYKAKCGVYTLLTMTSRANNAAMPQVEVVDMRKELENGNKSIFSERLKYEIEQNLIRGEQTILFLNRRGFSTFVSCRSCGFVAKCPNCNISLTYHRFDNNLKCHYCGYTAENYTVCPACQSKYIRYFGGGTQKVEDEIKKLFPYASTLRMDVDTTGRKSAHEKILETFEKDKTDILIGTQMVSKGLDFANVTLVGIVSADTMLNVDDFRCGERTFCLLEQVSGRAGRAEKAGRTIVQTYNPEHDAILRMQEHDYINFYKGEIQMRHAMWYPPFCEIVSVLITGAGENIVARAARFFNKQLAALKTLPQRTQVLGPIPAAISKINNKYRWRILIKCENADGLNSVLTESVKACYNNKSYERISIIIDKNPNSMY
ncbi:MAG: primosomal protein N' [Clostridia bacterium]|nr:primosomal protein N' [Clostridia bacterium]